MNISLEYSEHSHLCHFIDSINFGVSIGIMLSIVQYTQCTRMFIEVIPDLHQRNKKKSQAHCFILSGIVIFL